jgi:broad specificity phosphatase PhoE
MSSPPADTADPEAPLGIALVYETHSTTIDNERGVATGWLPGELSDLGRRQARDLGRRRRDDGIDLVLTSDLARAVQTAAIAFDGTSTPVMADSRLRECDYGLLTGKDTSHIRSAISFLDERFPRGESYRDVAARTADLLSDLAGRTDVHRVLIVAHSAQRWVLRALLGGEDLPDVLTGPDHWRPGWEYRLLPGWTAYPADGGLG